MQHLDEGTIHSWLDGALSAEDAAHAEAHVAGCPECAAAVAEARGFIAASSRILTALDNAPRGVIPVATPVKRVNPVVWRVAATVLVVAAGSLVVVQNRESSAPLKAISENQTTASQEGATGADRNEVVQAAGAAQTPTVGVADGASANPMVSKAAPAKTPEIDLSGKGPAANRRVATTDEKTAATESAPVRRDQAAATSDFARVPPPAAPLAPPPAVALAAMDAAAEPERLKVVGNPRQVGAKVTLYEVAPGDTVTLTEPIPVGLSSLVVTGAATGRMTPQTTAKSIAPAATAQVEAGGTPARKSELSREAAAAPTVAAAPQAAQMRVAIPIHTIRWIDAATGSTLTLSGRMPEARLQEIRIRIERERAAAAKKIP